MLKEHAKLLYLIEQAGAVCGRKKLQKIVYIAKRCGYDFGERFQFHFYGPYSEELSMKLAELHNLGFIQEQWEEKGGYTQYVYRIQEKGAEFLRLYPVEMEGLAVLVQQLNQHSARFLELVATLLYFDHLPRKERLAKLHQMKSRQQYTEKEIDEALALLDQLAG